MSTLTDPTPPSRDGDADLALQKGRAAVTGMSSFPSEREILAAIRRMDQISKDFHARTMQRGLSLSYRAFRNEHALTSKYLGRAFEGRSRFFVPKTRMAVRKNLATAAAALFSTDDVANVSAVFEDDEAQLAVAAVKKELLNYRLTRGFTPTSINWFQIVGGAALDAQITGMCVSKQYWQWQTADTNDMGPTQQIDPETGAPIMAPVKKIVLDRPMIDLIPIENCSLDPAAPWWDPVGAGAWFSARYGMYVGDAKAMMMNGRDQGWLDPEEIDFSKGQNASDERGGTRRIREGGDDRYEDARQTGDYDITWLVERFIRAGGRDLHCWTIGDAAFASELREVEEVYPAFLGERPYRMGVSGIETHRVVPMSPVESWQPLQLELNDIANLRIDTLKRSIAPLPKVKRGAKIDYAQLAARGQPETWLTVQSMDDVQFENVPPPNSAAFTETNVNNALFDELAGVMSTSSVSSNRQLNETVGGMQMMSAASNSVSEFDLRVFLETWAEPVLRQVVQLIDFYETDERAMAIAGAKAQAWTRWKREPTFDDLAMVETTVRVNAPIGAADPMQRMQKMKGALELVTPLLEQFMAKGATIEPEALVDEIFGQAGFKDGRRFFEFGEPPPPEQPPADPLAERKMALEEEKLGLKKGEIAANNKLKRDLDTSATKRELAKQMLSQADNRQARIEQSRQQGLDRVAEVFSGRGNTQPTNGAPQPQQPQQQQEVLPPSLQRKPDPVMQEVLNSLAAITSQQAQSQRLMFNTMEQIGEAISKLAEVEAAPQVPIRDPQTGRVLRMVRDMGGPPPQSMPAPQEPQEQAEPLPPAPDQPMPMS